MKTEMELVDNAIAMLQAFKDGKKLKYFLPAGSKPQLVDGATHLMQIICYGYEITIAPEPKEHWAVVAGDGNQTIFMDEEKAKAACERWGGRPSILSPYTLEHYRQVMP